MKYLSLLVFASGVVTLGVELSVARLLDPVLGNSQLVWAAIIGMVLLSLAVGGWLGGALADRFPQRRALDVTMTLAALGVALIPTLSAPILRLAARGLDYFAADLLVSSLVALLLLVSPPLILLGGVSPWAVRLAVRDPSRAGQISGRLYALGTAGSLVGAFLPVLWLIPAYGTRWSFFLLALFLLVVVALGSVHQAHRLFTWLSLLVVLALAWWSQPGASIRGAWDDGRDGLILYEDESFYNYIAVRQWGSERHLKLNDGVGIHSVHHPDTLLSLGIWDYFLLAPLFSADWRAGSRKWRVESAASQSPTLLIIGLAAGTVSELYTAVYGPLPITGVELDPQIIEVGRRYFAMQQPNLTAIADDGRRWLQQQPADARWSVIAIDAYRPPYIPFYLTTLEFFGLVYDHLSKDGVLVINVGRTASNFALVDALAATVAQHFPSVYAIDEPGPADMLGNSLLVATRQPTDLKEFVAAVNGLPNSLPNEFRQFAHRAIGQTRVIGLSAHTPILTDDHAPVEQIVHQIIGDFLAYGAHRQN
jgi:predicted membrane-bound spermidine synthase